MRSAVDIEVVEDHDITGLQEWGKLGFDINVERRPIHCAFNDPRCNKPITSQAAMKVFVPHLPNGAFAFKRVPHRERPPQAAHIGLH